MGTSVKYEYAIESYNPKTKKRTMLTDRWHSRQEAREGLRKWLEKVDSLEVSTCMEVTHRFRLVRREDHWEPVP